MLRMLMERSDEYELKEDDVHFFQRVVDDAADEIVYAVLDGKLKYHETVVEYMKDRNDIESGRFIREILGKWDLADAYRFIRGSSHLDVFNRIRNEFHNEGIDFNDQDNCTIESSILMEADSILYAAVPAQLFGERKIVDWRLQKYMHSDHVGPDKIAGNISRFKKYCIDCEELETPTVAESEPVPA